MKGLFITRGIDQQFELFVDPDTDPHELLRQMIEGVTVRVSDISSSWARLHIQAPPAVHIIRPEVHSKHCQRQPTHSRCDERESIIQPVVSAHGIAPSA